MKFLIIIIVAIIGVVISFILSKKNKKRYDKFKSFSDRIQEEINDIQERELKDLSLEINNFHAQVVNKHDISELIELSSSTRYTKNKIKRFYNPYTYKIEEFPESRNIYLTDSISDIEITSFDLEQLISEKIEKQKSTGKIIPIRQKIG